MSPPARIDELKKRYDENPRRFFAPLANEYRKLGDLEAAIQLCAEHLADQPGNMNGHVVYGQALFDAGRFPESRETFEAAIALDPENLIALRYLGDMARADGDADNARAWYRRVLDADPRNEEILAFLAELDQSAAAAPAAPAAPSATAPTAEPEPPPLPPSGARSPLAPTPVIPMLAVEAPPSKGRPTVGLIDLGMDFSAQAGGSLDEGLAAFGAPGDHATVPAEPAASESDGFASMAGFGTLSEPLPGDGGMFASHAADLGVSDDAGAGHAPASGADDAHATFGLPMIETGMPSDVPYEETTSPFGTGNAAQYSPVDLPPLDLVEDISVAPDTAASVEPIAQGAPAAPVDHTEEMLFGDENFSPEAAFVEPLAGLVADDMSGALVEPIAGLESPDSWVTAADIAVPEPPVLEMPTASLPTPDVQAHDLPEFVDFEPAPALDAVAASASAVRPVIIHEELEPPDEPVAFASEALASPHEPPTVPAELPMPEPTIAPTIEPVAEPVLEPAMEMAPEPAPARASAPAFVTETMAELYVKQGFREQAIAVYRQLVARRPDDETLAARLRELETPAVVAAASGPSARQFFSALAIRGAPQPEAADATGAAPVAAPEDAPAEVPVATVVHTPEADAAQPLMAVPVPAPHVVAGGSLDQLFGNVPPMGDEERLALAYAVIGDAVEPVVAAPASPAGVDAPSIKGKPTQQADTELSLDSVFREQRPSEGTPQRPFTRQSQMLRFDQFFTPTDEAPAPPAPPASSGEPGSPADIAHFSNWLQGLKDQ